MKDTEDLQRDVQSAITWEPWPKAAKIGIRAQGGAITLNGTRDSHFKKSAAEQAAKNAVGCPAGVKGAANGLPVKRGEDDDLERASIEGALLQNWSIDDETIEVKVSGHIVTLRGTVNSVYQKHEAARLAWNTPGVWFVKNELVIDYYLIDG